MPSKKKKYNARFPAGRIKKIMQSDEDVGKVAQAVPVIISRTLELFVESLLTKALRITNSRNAKTLSPSHMKQCIMSESRFDFLRDLVQNVPDINAEDQLSMNPQHQSYGTGTEADDEPSAQNTVHSYAPTARDFSRATATTLDHGSTSNYGEAYSSSDGHRNGVKRSISGTPQPSRTAHPQYYETSGRSQNHMLMHKQQSLDLSLATGPKNCTTPANYYTEIKSEDATSPLNLDVRPPKMSRLISAPNISATLTQSAPTTPAYPIITSTPPVINFDFSKGVATVQQYPAPIARLNLTVSSPLTTPSSPATFGGDIDVCNSPLVKIDYSQLDLSTPASPTVSRRTTLPVAAATAYTKVPAPRGRPPKNRTATITTPSPAMPPAMTFDFSHQPISASGTMSQLTGNSLTGPSSSSAAYFGNITASSLNKSNGTTKPLVASTSTCQDMDEDYDNI